MSADPSSRMPTFTQAVHLAARLGALWLAAFVAANAAAQDGRAPAQGDAEADCADDDAQCQARRKREEEAAQKAGSTVGGTGLAQGGGNLSACAPPGAACGQDPVPIATVNTPGRLGVRRLDISLGIDHALSPRWVIGALYGHGRATLERRETTTELFEADPPRNTVKDARVRARSHTLAAVLTWFPAPDVSVDGSVSLQRTDYAFQRVDSPGGLRYRGDNAGRASGLSLSASKAWRLAGTVIVSRAGLDRVDSRVDALRAVKPGGAPPSGAGPDTLEVSAQRTKVLAGLAELQAQWPLSYGFGVLLPHLRVTWQQRLKQHSDPIRAEVNDGISLITEAQQQIGKKAATVAFGATALFKNRSSVFVELGATRGSGELRETRLALGAKFER